VLATLAVTLGALAIAPGDAQAQAFSYVSRGRPLSGGVLLPPTSVATVHTVFSFTLNPGAFVQGSTAFGYLHEDGTKALEGARRSDGIFFRLGGISAGDSGGISLGFSQEWIRPAGGGCPATAPCLARASLGLSVGAPAASIGFAYRWYHSGESTAINDLGTLDLGLLLRPSQWMSLGFVIEAVNGPKFGTNSLPRLYTLGLGIRPGVQWLTLASDLAVDDRTGWRGSRIQYLATATWARGLEAMFQFGHNLETPTDGKLYAFLAGLRGSFGHTELALASGTTLDGGNGGVGGVVTFQVSTARGPSLIRTTRAVEIDLADELQGPSTLAKLIGLEAGLDAYTKLALRLDQLTKDPAVRTVVFTIRGTSGLSFGRMEELRGRIRAMQTAGKQVVAYLEDASDADYYLATSANRIYAAPQALLLINGLSSQRTFLRGLLDILKIEPEFVKIGAYKSAPEQFTNKTPSEASAEETNSLLDDQFSRYVNAIATSRNLTPEKVKELLNRGLWISEKAVGVGLIDQVSAGGSALRETLRNREDKNLAFEKLPSPNEQPLTWGDPPAIGLVEVVGTIGSGLPGGLGGEVADAETVVKQIRKAVTDPTVRAIVVRIDSPGGDVGASELMWQAVADAQKKKPVVASFGDVAASGGYYVGSAAGTIIAEPSTITGSIGVFAGKANLSKLFDTIGINTTTFKRGDHADFFTLTRAWTPQEREVAADMVRTFYETFLERVAAGRRMTRDQVDAVAQGRVWTGAQAKERGLVDHLGGLSDALQEASRQAGLPVGGRVVVMGAKGLFDLPEVPAKVEALQREQGQRQWMHALPVLRALFGGAVEERSLEQSWPILQALMEGRPLALATDLPLVR
jgi:protease-4